MSGVRTGSRLEQLEALRNRLNQEIAQERRRAILAGEIAPPRPPRQFRTGRGTAPAADALLARLGVHAHTVKVWAVETGLIPTVARGRVPLALIEAYAAAVDQLAQEAVDAVARQHQAP